MSEDQEVRSGAHAADEAPRRGRGARPLGVGDRDGRGRRGRGQGTREGQADRDAGDDDDDDVEAHVKSSRKLTADTCGTRQTTGTSGPMLGGLSTWPALGDHVRLRRSPSSFRERSELELLEQRQAGRAPAALEPRQRGGEARDDGDVADAVEGGPGAPGRVEQAERDRRLVREQTEQLHLLQREARALRPVEHLQHSERPLVVRAAAPPSSRSARSPSSPPRRAAKRGSFATSSSTSGVRDDSTQPAMPVSRGHAPPDEILLAGACHRGEDELVGLLVEEEDRGRAAPKIARATSTTDRSRSAKSFSAARTPAATAACIPFASSVMSRSLPRSSR